MLIKTLTVGHLETNCYIVTNENTLECVVIDPGDESNSILDYLEDNKLKCKAIFLTHGHFDHVMAVDSVSEETGSVVYMNKQDDAKVRKSAHFPFTLPENGIYYADGDVINICGLSFKIYSTPGHTPGGVTIQCEDSLFTGDTLFKGSCGRTDLDGGDPDAMMRSLKKICSIDGDPEVYPGHLDCSNLEKEKLLNYYCRRAMAYN